MDKEVSQSLKNLNTKGELSEFSSEDIVTVFAEKDRVVNGSSTEVLVPKIRNSTKEQGNISADDNPYFCEAITEQNENINPAVVMNAFKDIQNETKEKMQKIEKSPKIDESMTEFEIKTTSSESDNSLQIFDESNFQHEVKKSFSDSVSSMRESLPAEINVLISEKSTPSSYSDSDLDETENTSSFPKKTASLPYFQLPKPDLEEFLLETDKNFLSPHIKKSAPSFSPKNNEVKDTNSDIFLIEENTSKIYDEISRSSSSYKCMLTSIEQLDDSKSPGIKRLILKKYLLKKIQEKKKMTFERSKQIANLDEEMEAENEEIPLHSDSSVEDIFEVPFGKQSYELDDECSHSEEFSSAVNNDESDDDICIRKKTQILSSDDEEETEAIGMEEHQREQYSLDSVTRSHHNDMVSAIEKNDFSPEKKVQKNIDDYSSSDENESKMLTMERDIKESVRSDDVICARKEYKITQNINYHSSDDEPCTVTDDDFHNHGVSRVSTMKRSNEKYRDIKNNENPEKDNVEGDLSLKSFDCNEVNNSQVSSSLELNKDEEGMAVASICSSIPSYQPGGGFHSEEDEEEMVVHRKCENISLKKRSDFSSSSPILEDKFDDNSVLSASTFGLSLGDPPISDSDKSEIFASQDLANLCSGVFKTDALDGEKSFLEKENPDKTKEEKVQDFFDIEAELSGDDDGIEDDQEGDDDIDNELLVIDDCELPAEEELRDEIADLHMKRMRDDDDEFLKEIKEKFLDDGELNNDGTSRTRRFAWKNSDVVDSTGKDKDISSDSDSSLDETWSSMSKEKAKWRQKNEEEDPSEKLCSSHKKPFLKVNIIGKPEFARREENSPKHLVCKRPRGSFLHMDESSQVLKKLKASEDRCDGSRTTKHFVFRNDLSEVTTSSDLVSVISKDPVSGSRSVFNVI